LAEVLRNLLVGSTNTTTALLRETARVLAWSSTGDTSHHHTGLRSESHSTLASVARKETLLARSIEDSGLHVLWGIISINIIITINHSTYRLRHSSGSGSLLLSDGVTGLDACFELHGVSGNLKNYEDR
jgi:hypothetical protein